MNVCRIEFASDIKSIFPEKEVTLVHSGTQLLPRFDVWMHNESEYSPPFNHNLFLMEFPHLI